METALRVVAPFQLNLLSVTTDRVWVAMWVQKPSKKISFCLIILDRVAADTLSAKTRPKKSHLVPGPPISLYESPDHDTLTSVNERNMMPVIFVQYHPMGRTPNSRKEETHERIVEAAGRAIRKHGYTGVGVADVMKEAGLTHGGFYAHFDSRDALLVEALERAGCQSLAVTRAAELRAGKGVSAFRSLVETYLADDHLASLETGCPVAALGCDMPRQSEIVREASAVLVQRLIAAVRSTLPAAPRATARVVAGTLVGSLQLARALGSSAQGRAVLSAARKSLIQQYDRPGAAGH